MTCYYPLTAYRDSDNTIKFREPRNCLETLTLPCGQCVGCRLERSRQWAIRCAHEASLYQKNSFITLTYNDSNLPIDKSLNYEDFQKFMKRLRFSQSGHQPNADGSRPIRFYMCGEYGENFGRPHYHACIFNYDFPDKKLWKVTPSKSRLYTSEILSELWPFGYSSIGDVNFQSAAYVARYIMKKINGRAAETHYEHVDPDTGEVFNRKPEFNKMSLKPGIGKGWFDKFNSDVYPSDEVIMNGKKMKPPKYYDRQYELLSPLEMDEIKHERYKNSNKYLLDNTPSRLMVREQVQLANLNQLKRKLT